MINQPILTFLISLPKLKPYGHSCSANFLIWGAVGALHCASSTEYHNSEQCTANNEQSDEESQCWSCYIAQWNRPVMEKTQSRNQASFSRIKAGCLLMPIHCYKTNQYKLGISFKFLVNEAIMRTSSLRWNECSALRRSQGRSHIGNLLLLDRSVP